MRPTINNPSAVCKTAEDHTSSPRPGETVKRTEARVLVQRHDAPGGHDPRHHRHHQRAPPEVVAEVFVADGAGVSDQEDGGEVGGGGDEGAPVSSGNTPVQLEVGSPLPPGGTAPEATAPTTVPMKNGGEQRGPEHSNHRSAHRGPGTWRKAKPEPRSTIPSAASASGM